MGVRYAMVSIRRCLIVGACLLAATAARAADVVYPPGSRIGLVPPAGVVTSKNFFGYEDPAKNVGIILAALPVDAYGELEKTITAEALKKQGITQEARESLSLAGGKAFLVTGRQEAEKTRLRKWFLIAGTPTLTALVTAQVPEPARAAYPDAAIRAALRSLTVRTTIPVEEQLGLLPFKVGELAGFGVGGVVPGRAVMLSDGVSDAPGTPAPGGRLEPHIFVAVAAGGPAQAGERENFARDVFATVPNLKDARITTSEPLRISAQPGHQIFANAKDPGTGAALMVVQWLRFGGGAYLQLVGIARADAWKDAYPRFRTVRDAIEPR
jgi:hypothetical protein